MSSKIFQDVFKASSQSVMIPGILINDSSLSMIFQMYKILSQFASKIQTKCQKEKTEKTTVIVLFMNSFPLLKCVWPNAAASYSNHFYHLLSHLLVISLHK